MQSSSTEDESGRVSRRQLLTAIGAAGVGGVAGCSDGTGGDGSGTDSGDGNGSDGSGDGNASDGASGASLRDPAFTTYADIQVPSNAQFNRYNQKNFSGGTPNSPGAVMFEPLLALNNRSYEWDRWLVSEFAIDGTTLTITLDSAYTWSDGDQVTARDLETQLRLDKFFKRPVWDLLEGIESVDGQTITLSLSDTYAPDVVRTEVNTRLHVKHSEYSEWLERLRNASSEDKRNDIISELSSTAISDPVTNGPYTLETANQQKFKLVRHEGYPLSTNVPEYEYLGMPSTNKRWQAFIGDELDGGWILVAQQDVEKKFPDHVKKVTVPGNYGMGLFVQHDHEILGKRRVRQALAYLIDQKQIEKNIHPRNTALETSSGLLSGQVEQWLENPETFGPYGPEAKPEEAAQLLEEAGYSKSNGTWQSGSGEPLKLSVKAFPWPEPTAISQTVTQVMRSFGLDAEMVNKEASSLSTEMTNGEFELVPYWSYGGPHPYLAYTLLTNDPLKKWSNVSLDVAVPPVGDPDGSRQSMDVTGKINDLATTTEDSQTTELVRDLAWYYSRVLPTIPLVQQGTPSYYTTDDFQFPAQDHEAMYYEAPLSSTLRIPQEGTEKALFQGRTK